MAQPLIAIVGAGAMGANHIRVVANSGSVRLGPVVDGDERRARQAARVHGADAFRGLEAACVADAAVVAVSTAAHLECALELIEHGVPLLIEKPLATSLVDVDRIIDRSRELDVPVMCGFVERFNAAFQTGMSHIDSPVTHVVGTRHSPPAPRIASSVVGDLLLHDLDLTVALFGEFEPELVGALRLRPPGSLHAEIADCHVRFRSGMATLSANRTAQRKVRLLSIHTSTCSIEVDLMRQDVTVYRNLGQEIVQLDHLAGYRQSTVIDIPFVRHAGEPLELQLAHFVELISGRADAERERRSIRPAHVLMDAIETTGTLIEA